MEIPLSRRGCRNPVPFKVIIQGLDSAQTTAFSELKLGVFSETRSVGIEEGASVAETLEDELCSGDLGDQL